MSTSPSSARSTSSDVRRGEMQAAHRALIGPLPRPVTGTPDELQPRVGSATPAAHYCAVRAKISVYDCGPTSSNVTA